jgi:hypothetical protein
MIGFIFLSFTVQPIITAHSQWLPKIRSIPYWTTSVFSSAVTDLVLIYESLTSSTNGLRLSRSQSQIQRHIATDDQSFSQSWCRAPSGAHDQIFVAIWQLRSCYCGAPSLTRGGFYSIVLVCTTNYIVSGLRGKYWLLVRIRENICNSVNMENTFRTKSIPTDPHFHTNMC